MSKYMGQTMAECDCQHKTCEVRGYCMAERIKQLESDLSFMKACHGELAHQYKELEVRLVRAVMALQSL
jgi:hypothetical protein